MLTLAHRWIGAAALVAAALLAVIGASTAQEKFPVWWSPELGVDSRAEVERRLSERLPADLRITLGRQRYEVNPHEQGPVDTCNDYIRFRADGFVAKSADDHPAAYALRRKCYPLWALLRAEPARISHVRSFKMANDAFDYLPPFLFGACRGIPAFAEANRAGVPWNRFFESETRADRKSFTRGGETFVEQIILDGELWSEDVFSIIGRGDFDGDGQDDLLVRMETVHVGLGIGTDLNSLFLLTRNGPTEVLRATESFSPFGSVGRACFVDPAYLRPRE